MLITFLGKVSDWKNAKYKLNSKEFKSNNYFSEILNHFKENEILIVITESLLNSENKEKEIISDLIVNLYKNLYKNFMDEDNKNIINNLNVDNINKLEKFKENKKIYFLIIKDDNTENILEKLKGKLKKILDEKNKKIYLDITHSYRYLPVLVLFALDILENLENLNLSIEEIIYAKQINDDEYEIKTLRDLQVLNKLTKAVEDFYQKGVLQNIADIYVKQGKKFQLENLKDLGEALKDLDFYLNLNILEEINESFDKVSNILNEIDENDLEFPLSLIHNDIKEFIDKFTKKSKISEKQLELAKWHLKNDRLLLGLITLQESIRSKHMEKDNIEDVFNLDERKKYYFSIDKILKSLGNNLNDNDKFNCCLNILSEEENKYIKYWCLLTNLRNAGGHNLAEGEKQRQIKNIKNCKEEYEKFLKELKNEEFIEELYQNIDLSSKKDRRSK